MYFPDAANTHKLANEQHAVKRNIGPTCPPPPTKHRFLVPVQRSKPSGTSFLRIFLSNTRSVVNKLDEISETVTNNLCNIAVITESWLSSCVTDQLISIPGYESRQRDRPDHQCGGGLCTFINSRLDFVQLQELDDPDIESQWFVIKPNCLLMGINSIILGTIYHLPQSDDNKLRAHLFNNLDTLSTRLSPELCSPGHG